MKADSVTLRQLASHLWEAANILRGPVDAADLKTYIFPLLFFKRISDVHDEEYQGALEQSRGDEAYAAFPQNYRFQLPEGCHWRDVRAATANVGQALQRALRGIEKANPDTLYGIFGDAQWSNKERLSDALLRDPVEHSSGRELTLANLPYSIKQRDPDAFADDPSARNVYGTAAHARADHAFWQHVLTRLPLDSGRWAVLFPHGALFRQDGADMHSKLIENDPIECVLGLGTNFFCNSPMEACVAICWAAKPQGRRGRILFINAVNEVAPEQAQSFLTNEHTGRIVDAYQAFTDQDGLARVAQIQAMHSKHGNLKISVYVYPPTVANSETGQPASDLTTVMAAWLRSTATSSETLSDLPDVQLEPAWTF